MITNPSRIRSSRYLRAMFSRLFYKLIRPAMNFLRLETRIVVGDPARLHISPSASVHNAYFNVMSGIIHVGRNVFFGHNVSIITGTHDYRSFGQSRIDSVPQQDHDIFIEEGAWIASNSTVIGPCKIGAHAVVAAGAVVVRDVAPLTIVGGVPARLIRVIDSPGHEKKDS